MSTNHEKAQADYDRLGYVHNAWYLARLTNIASAEPITGRGHGWKFRGQEWWDGQEGGYDGAAWDAMVKATGITEWVYPKGFGNRGGAWFPAQIVKVVADRGIIREGGKKITWNTGRPCEESVLGEWSSHRCERPVVEVVEVRDGKTKPLCGLHAKAREKRIANDEARREAWDASREREARRKEHKALADELIEWAGPLLAELGIHPKTVTTGSIGTHTGVLLPAEAIATLIELATGERYPGRGGNDS